MKEEWKVFIRGVPNRGEEVIKALIDLGAKKLFYTTSGSNEKFIHFINYKGEIDYVSLDTEQAQIIMDYYKEIKLPQQLKDGDLLVHTDDDGSIEYVVYKETKGFNDYTQLNSILTYANVNRYTYGVNVVFDKDKCKLASNEEHKEFYDLLHKHGADWDSENKQLVKWKWKPKYGEGYYYIFSDGTVHLYTWFNDKIDTSRFDLGNCFKTEEEAEIAAEKIKKLLNAKS